MAMDMWLADFANWCTEAEEREAFALTLCREFANWTKKKEEEDQAFAFVLWEEFKHWITEEEELEAYALEFFG